MKAKLDLLTIRANDDHDRILFAAIDDDSEQARHMIEVLDRFGVDYVRRSVTVEVQPWPLEEVQ